MKRRSHGTGGHGNTERWLLTYADMITLLMAFFILMYTISRVDAEKFRSLSKGLQTTFKTGAMFVSMTPPLDSSSQPFHPLGTKGAPTLMGMTQVLPAAYRVTVKGLKRFFDRTGQRDNVKVSMERRGLVISLTSGILFDIQSSVIRPEAKEVLDNLGFVLSGIPNQIVIEGHTDEQSFVTRPKGPSPNWSLSAKRALAVLEYLVGHEFVTEERLSLAGFAANRPSRLPARNQDEQNRLNRRVDLVLVGETPFNLPAGKTIPVGDFKDDEGW